MLPTLDAAMSALAESGGKIICSLSALPTWGPGRLFRRDEGKLHGIDTEKKLFQTEHPGWRRTADKMVEYGVGVDFFMAAPGGVYMDVATIGRLDQQLSLPLLTHLQGTYLDLQEERSSIIPIFMRREIASNSH